MFKPYYHFNKSDAMHLLTLHAGREDFAGYCIYNRRTLDDLVAAETVITFVARGEKVICTKDGEYPMKVGDALVVKAGTGIHSEILWKERAFESINIALKRSLLGDYYYQNHRYFFASASRERPKPGTVQEDRPGRFILSDNVHVTHYIHSLIPYFQNPYRIRLDRIARLKFFELLTILLETEPDLFYDEFAEITSDDNAAFHSRMIENIATPLSLEKLAGLCNMSLSTFKRKFLELYGEPPRRWMIRKRLELACILLKTSRQSVTEVCFCTGFENLSHFIMTFKTRHGVTPTEYRMACNRQRMI